MRATVSAPLLSDLSGFVAASLGLHFPEERWSDLERGLVSIAREFGQRDAEAFGRWLLSRPMTRSLLEVLASHLTVGETYFFREQPSLQAFEERILPELVRLREEGERRLRIWSAGCCTGEEPYTIAMILDRWIDLARWNVTLLATDINPQFLRKAAEGVYGQWSFRGTPATIRERYFRKRKDGRLELHPRIRGMVSFSYLNLATDVYPSLLNNTNAMDVIFCRNVLMYFSAERTREVSRNFHRSLVPGGWLIVSSVESSNSLYENFSAVQLPGVALYRKSATEPSPEIAATQTQRRPPPPAAAEPVRFEQSSVASPQVAPAASAVAAVPVPQPDQGQALVARARRSANEGNLGDAAQWCEQAIAADKMNPTHHYLLATIRQEQRQTEAAAQSLVRALYLDPGFVLAHVALANIELSRGRQREARRHFTNARAALRSHAQDEVLPESEGLTAGRLGEIITSVLASLPRAESLRAGEA